MKIKILPINQDDINWIKQVFSQYWSGDFIVTRKNIHKAEEVGGFIAYEKDQKIGLITYKITNKYIEIISLNSFLENKGVGSLLVNEIIQYAKDNGFSKVFVITTNDNLKAINFYLKRGFAISNIYSDSVADLRKIKPQIPLIGLNNLPIKDEIELEIRI